MPPAPPPTIAETAFAESQQLWQLWTATKAFLAKAETQDPVTREEEQAFLEAKTDLSRLSRSIPAKLPEGVGIAADKLQDILRQAISISHLRSLPKPDKLNLVLNWHAVFIHVSRATGALQLIAEGYTPNPVAKKQGTGLKDIKAGSVATSPKKKSRLKSPMTWVVVVIIAVVVMAAMNR